MVQQCYFSLPFGLNAVIKAKTYQFHIVKVKMKSFIERLLCMELRSTCMWKSNRIFQVDFHFQMIMNSCHVHVFCRKSICKRKVYDRIRPDDVWVTHRFRTAWLSNIVWQLQHIFDCDHIFQEFKIKMFLKWSC